MSDLREIQVTAEEYIERGWPIIPIPPINGQPAKGPMKKGWPENLLKAGSAALVLQAHWNIGLLLRELVDIDFDCEQACGAGPVFLPETGLVYGHGSSAASHLLYRITTPLPYKKFTLADDDERGALLELRSMLPATNGTKPKAFQSVLPPSVHPCGEQYVWNKYEEPTEVSGRALWRAVHLVAIAAGFARLHPAFDDAHKAARDEYRLAISGVLGRRLPADDALNVFTNALRIAGDNKDRRSIFQTTLQKLHAGGDAKIKGMPSLAAIIGQKAASSIAGWIDAISEKEHPSATSNPNGRSVITTALPVLEDEEEPPVGEIPTCPLAAIEGDFIGDMTHALTDGTFIPPIFVRENIKVILGAVINGKVGLRSHPNIHMREYHIAVSHNPQAGKFESWERTGGENRGFLHDFLKDAGELGAGLTLGPGIALIDGGIFGSGEFMAAILSLPENKRSIAYFDEMSECFEKDKTPGSILEKKLLQLFEGDTITQGSFKNKTHVARGVEFSLVGCFTLPSFLGSFTGRGAAGSGLLSRCTFSYSDRVRHIGDWSEIDVAHVMELRSKIASCLGAIPGQRNRAERYILEETSEATRLRHDVATWIDALDDRYKPRLADHLKRDLILRAVFSPKPIIDTEKVERAKLWIENQYTNRFVLWPEDAGSNLERMENIIINTLEKAGTPLSDNRLATACNARRLGSGGFNTLHAAIIALIRTDQIKIVGKTRKGRSVYERIR
jgi:hypothetical protein